MKNKENIQIMQIRIYALCHKLGIAWVYRVLNQ